MKRLLTFAAMFQYCMATMFAQFTGIVTDGQGVRYTANDDETTCYVSGHEDSYNSSIVIPDIYLGRNVTAIGSDAFWRCYDLYSVVIPEGVTSIGKRAFARTALTSIDIPSTVVEIGDYCFSITSLSNIMIPQSLTSLSLSAFDECDLAQLMVEHGNPVYDSRNNCNAIIETATNTLYIGCKNTEIPEDIKHIGDFSFNQCRGLLSIDIPDQVVSIGTAAFQSCTSLSSVSIPRNVYLIGNSAFNMCNSLSSISLPKSLKYLNGSAFSGCEALATIISHVKKPIDIQESVFSSTVYTNATLFVPKGSMTVYRNNENWNKFSNIIESDEEEEPQGETARSIYVEQAGSLSEMITAEDKYDIEELTLTGEINGTDFRLIRDMAGCDYLGNITGGCLIKLDLSGAIIVAGGDKYLDTDKISVSFGTSLLGSFRFNTTNNTIGRYMFAGCSSLQTIILPNSITTIETTGLAYCQNLEAIDVPNSVMSIGAWGVSNCFSLKTVKIPKSVTSIGMRAFYGCKQLSTINIAVVIPFAISENVFNEEIYAAATLIVPKGCKEKYQSTEGWKKFSNIEEGNNQDPHNTIPEAIDLGLSVKWASWNVGTDKPEGLGNLYAWGELTPKADYSTSTYKFYDSGYFKYGSMDGKYRLDSEDDVAHQMWGDKWRIPTFEELEELNDNCTFTPTELNGVSVTKVTGPNGNFINFPYPGNFTGSSLYYENSVGSYWSSDLQSDSYAKDLDFRSGYPSLNGDSRYHGQSIRPVYVGEEDYFGKVADIVDLGLSVKWASWNLGAANNDEYGGLYGMGDSTGSNHSTSASDYYYEDGVSLCGTDYDLAHTKWGDNWRLPTKEELKELKEKCTWTHNIKVGDVYGSMATGPNGNTLFLPYSGCRHGEEILERDYRASIWSGDAGSPKYDYGYMDFDVCNDGILQMDGSKNWVGQSIRPVYVEGKSHDMSISTIIFNASSQPILVGGIIDNYASELIVKKGIIVSKNVDDMIITEDTRFDKANIFLNPSKPSDLRFIDCTGTNEEEYVCALQFLMGDTDYYVKAFIIEADGNVIYGNTEKVHTQVFSRYNGSADVANVYYAFSYTLFDLVTDEIINPAEGFYYSTNENPTTVRFQTGNRQNTCYKFSTEWNYLLWYHQIWNWNNSSQSYYNPLHIPIMKYADRKLYIKKNPLDADKDVTIFYSINGNFFRPESYTDVYEEPLELIDPCTVCCYAISSDGNVSYTNIYMIDEISNESIENDENIENGEDTDISQLDNTIYIERIEAAAGQQIQLSLKMKNSAPIRSFQFDLYLPAGMTVAKTSKGKIMGQLSPGRLPDEDEHTLTFSEQPDGAIRFLCGSQYDEVFTGNDGEIATLTVNISETMEEGDYPLLLKGIVLSETDITKYYETALVKSTLAIISYILGDINGDGIVNVLDYTGVANHIHGSTPAGFVEKAADVDENDIIDVRDYTGVANIIHTGSITGASTSRANKAKKNTNMKEPQ
jgi:hypothetical protein